MQRGEEWRRDAGEAVTSYRWLKVRYGPITLWNVAAGHLYGDTHILASSPVRSRGLQLPSLSTDQTLRSGRRTTAGSWAGTTAGSWAGTTAA